MKYLFTALFLASCQATTPQLDLTYGTRVFDNSQAWEETNTQEMMGFQVNYAGKSDIGLEIGVNNSEGDTHDRYLNRNVNVATTTVNELYIGLRKSHTLNNAFQVFISGGMSGLLIETEVDLAYSGSPKDQDIGYAPYVGAGVNWFVTDDLSVGFMYRHHFLNESVDIFATNPDLDSDAYLMTLGWIF